MNDARHDNQSGLKRPLRIGNYVSQVSVRRGYEKNVSGHIQVPLKAMELLHKAGHDVHLITNRYSDDRTLPACMPEGVAVHTVLESRERRNRKDAGGKGRDRVRMRLFFKQAAEIRQIARENEFDVLHFYGYTRTAALAGYLRMMGLGVPVCCTLFGANMPSGVQGLLSGVLSKRVDALITATEYVQKTLGERGLKVHRVGHGIIRDLRAEHDGSPIGERKRVLFWRDPSPFNGADVALAVYDRLAPKYPQYDFDMAIRPNWNEVPGIEEVAAKHANIHIHRFPYPEGITLPALVLGSVCVLMPIRRMSIDPQLVIAESMAVGVPVIATDQRSNPEVVTHGRNGMIVPLGDVDATTAALDEMLSNRERLDEMGRNAEADMASNWNWNHYVDDVMPVYESLLSGKAAQAAMAS